MCPVKHITKEHKNSKIGLFELGNDTDYFVALQALGCKPLETERKKGNKSVMFKLLNKMDPKSLTNLFSPKDEMTNYKLRNMLSSLSLPKPRTNNIKKVMYDGACPFLPFRKKIATNVES